MVDSYNGIYFDITNGTSNLAVDFENMHLKYLTVDNLFGGDSTFENLTVKHDGNIRNLTCY